MATQSNSKTVRTPALDPITLFVAMPYTNFGANAKWPKPLQVEMFYKQVGKTIEKKMKRKVKLLIVKYEPKSGLVIEDMFRAIHTADVFIADITGCNANVFFELGLRYGLSKNVTILTSQDDQPPPFDINQVSVVRYANGPSQEPEAQIAAIVFNELGTQRGDSHVLSLLNVEIVPRDKWRNFSGDHARHLVEKSTREKDPQVRLDHLREAVQACPLSELAHIELARVLRECREFDAALQAISEALRVFNRSAQFRAQLYKERGATFDRMTTQGEDRLDKTIEAYSTALALDDADVDLHGCYGGALRRKGLQSRDADRTRYLQEALHHYHKSSSIDRHSTYAGLNVLRLQMLMADSPQDFTGSVGEYLQRMYHLCAFEVTDSQIKAKEPEVNADESQIKPEDKRVWRLFDLADVLALKNDRDQALDTYQQAIALIPDPQRETTLTSPIRSWKELLTEANLSKAVSTNAEDILKLLESYKNPSSV